MTPPVKYREFDLPVNFSPDEKLWIMTDLHGNYEAMKSLLALKPEDARFVYLGDAIDRGPCCFEVVEELLKADATCLWGNHEGLAWLWINQYDAAGYEDIASSIGATWYLNGMEDTVQSVRTGMLKRSPFYESTEDEELLANFFSGYFPKLRRYFLSGNIFLSHVGFPGIIFGKDFFDTALLPVMNVDSWLWFRADDFDNEYLSPHHFDRDFQVYSVFGHTSVQKEHSIFPYGLDLDYGPLEKAALLLEPKTEDKPAHATIWTALT